MPIYWVCTLLPRPVVVTFMKILVYLGLDANICPLKTIKICSIVRPGCQYTGYAHCCQGL